MKICMGELLQLTSKRHYEQPVEAYYTKIERKTATMLSAACHCGAIVAGMGEEPQRALERYGRDLGIAFQIADDVLDYTATEEQLGKPTGADLRQGTVTLPLMYALKDPAVGPALRPVLAREPLSDADCDEVVALVRGSAAVAEAERRAHEFADRARAELAIFPDSEARSALESICDYVVERRT
jgi:geranylgeranyl pyrophosphate synthase